MNVERADPSFTAWDNAIVAKSKGLRTETAGKSGAPEGAAGFSYRRSKVLHAAKKRRSTRPSPTPTITSAPMTRPGAAKAKSLFGFWDLVDIINPLQHIPVVSTIYRDLTGDTISAPARIAGGMLYGGPLGFASSIGNAIVEETSGKDIGEIAMAMFSGDEETPEAPSDEGTALASAAPARPSESAAAPAQPAIEEASIQTASTQTATAQTQAPQPENAGAAAVSQMQANNAALQALLKDMGLSQAAPTASAALPEPAVRPAGTPGAVGLERGTVTGAVQQLASREEAAGRPAATTSGPGSAPAPAPSQVQAAVTGTAAASKQDEAAPQRKSFPIDPSRHINTRAASRSPSASSVSQTAAVNRAVTETSENAAATPSENLVKAAASGQIPEQDRTALQSSFADRMLDALDRYQSMSKDRSDLPDIGSGELPGGTPGAI